MRGVPTEARNRLLRCLDDLREDPWPENLDVRPLVGYRPWWRIREGSYRILMRPLTDKELSMLGVELPEDGFLVFRVLDKQYVKRAIRRLPKLSNR